MKKILIFFAVFLLADTSDTILKIKEIQASKKIFLKYPFYNIFIQYQPVNVNFEVKRSNISYSLKLYAIFNNKANINGEWKRVGENINGYQIVKITPNYVLLKKDNKLKVLKFSTNIIKVLK